ncbi:similar to An01g13960 [Aspergillus luchuensis IFO 4308]|nr:similar to An01g13960 [Aspergillus luchuensis IFO 4308]
MTSHQHLRGSCQCGRNQYQIRLPDNITDHAHVYLDTGRDNRRFHAAPLTAWLRVPLTWYQSHTQSYFPDETHSTIRRIFSPHHAPHTQRVFCGYCGTPLTFWSEDPREEAEYMSVSIGSLFGDGQRMLEDLELLPPESPPHSSDEEREAEEEGAGPAKGRKKLLLVRLLRNKTPARQMWSFHLGRRSHGVTDMAHWAGSRGSKRWWKAVDWGG